MLNRFFLLVAKSKSQEAFLAVMLLTVIALSSITEGLGLSGTLGAFLAGTLLSETKYTPQVCGHLVVGGRNIAVPVVIANAGASARSLEAAVNITRLQSARQHDPSAVIPRALLFNGVRVGDDPDRR